MTSIGTLMVGTVGLKLQIKLKTGRQPTDPVVNLTGYSDVYFDVQKPDATPGEEGQRTQVAWTGAMEAPLTDGIISYTLQADDLDAPGPYIIQPRIEKAGVVLKGAPHTLQVKADFDD